MHLDAVLKGDFACKRPFSAGGLRYAKGGTMNAIPFGTQKKDGSTAKAIAMPCNRSQEAHFNWVDAAIIGFVILAAGGLLGWLLLS